MNIKFVFTAAVLLSASALSFAADVRKGNSFERCNTQGCSQQAAEKFSLDTLPLGSDLVIGETFFFAEELPKLYKTSFTPLSIISVYDPRTGKPFKEGTDYKVVDQGIDILPGSTMKSAPAGFMTSPESDLAKSGLKPFRKIPDYQYAITYRKKEHYRVKTIGFLSKFKNSKSDKKIRVTFFGDSITFGSDTSFLKSPELQPGYVQLVMSRLETLYPGKFLYRNNSVPGISSQHAAWWVDSKLNDQPSDLIVLAFGMNDSSNLTPEKYKANIASVINSVRKKNPDTEFILLSPMRPIKDSKIHHQEYFNKYVSALKDLAIDNTNVKAVDFTDAWDRVSKNKRFYDLTANGLHHPNDYVHKVMAETVLASMPAL